MNGEPEQIKHQTEELERNTVLANERTYAAWIRTGLTTFATSLAVEPLLIGQVPRGPLVFISIFLALSSALFFYLAAWRYKNIAQLLKTSRLTGAPISLLITMSTILVLIALTVATTMSLKISGEMKLWIQALFSPGS